MYVSADRGVGMEGSNKAVAEGGDGYDSGKSYSRRTRLDVGLYAALIKCSAIQNTSRLLEYSEHNAGPTIATELKKNSICNEPAVDEKLPAFLRHMTLPYQLCRYLL